MARIIFKFRNKVLGVYPLVSDQALTIGRRQENDIVIDNLAVSGLHARIDSYAGKHQLTDLESKNGTFLNGQSIASCRIHHQDVITIGKHKLVVDLEDCLEVEAQPSAGGRAAGGINIGPDQTMVMNPDQYREMLRQEFESDKADKSPEPRSAVLLFLKGGQGSLRLDQGPITIGKNREADVVITGLWSFLCGAPAATVERKQDGIELACGGGLIKPRVNGQIVKGKVGLQAGDIIEIGPVKLSLGFEQPDLQ